MSRFVGAIDQGTTSSRFIVFDNGGRDRHERAKRAHADLSAARLGRARRARDLAQHSGSDRRRARARGPARRRPRRGWDHESTRDDAALGSPHGAAAAQRAGLAGHARRGPRRDLRARRRPRSLPRRRPGCRSRRISARLKLRVVARPRPGRARSRRARRRAVRHDGLLAALEPHRRTRRRLAPHRRHERKPHAADESLNAANGTMRCSRAFEHTARRCCRAYAASSEVYGDAPDRGARWRAARGHPRRPAGRAGGPDLLRAGRSEEHLRHRLLHADEHRHATRAVDGTGS